MSLQIESQRIKLRKANGNGHFIDALMRTIPGEPSTGQRDPSDLVPLPHPSSWRPASSYREFAYEVMTFCFSWRVDCSRGCLMTPILLHRERAGIGWLDRRQVMGGARWSVDHLLCSTAEGRNDSSDGSGRKSDSQMALKRAMSFELRHEISRILLH